MSDRPVRDSGERAAAILAIAVLAGPLSICAGLLLWLAFSRGVGWQVTLLVGLLVLIAYDWTRTAPVARRILRDYLDARKGSNSPSRTGVRARRHDQHED